MSLLVWLPLNGNLSNQGLRGDVTVTVTGTTAWNNTGKIGKCLSCNGSTFWNLNPVTIGTNASFCWWAKTTDPNCMFFVVTASVNNNLNIWAYNGYLYLNTGDSTSNPFKSDNGSMITSKVDNVWHHYAVTFDGSKCSLYIDGKYVGKAQTYKSPASNSTKMVRIAGGYSNAHTYDLTGSLNDFRIYDHCLSAKEVHEITKGLVLHYKLDQDPLFGKNLLPTNMQRNQESGSSSSNEYFNLFDATTIWDTYGLVPYTVSFDAKAKIAHSFNLYGNYGNGPKYMFTNTSINVDTEWKRFSYTFTPRLNNESGTWSGCSIYGIYGSGAIVSVRRVKLELGSIATPMDYDPTVVVDASGYGNDGVINGDIVSASDGPRYESCVINSQSYPLKSVFDFPESNGLTISCLVYEISNVGANRGVWTTSTNSTTSSTDHTNTTCSHTDNYFKLKGTDGNLYTISCGSSDIPLNVWKLITLTHDGVDVKLYIDGNFVRSISCPTSLVGFKSFWLGHSYGDRTTQGKWSDLRIYSTALSADDIKELYDTGAWIDNGYNVEAYEFVEDSAKEFTKTGLAKFDLEEVTGQTNIYKTGKMTANQLIEI